MNRPPLDPRLYRPDIGIGEGQYPGAVPHVDSPWQPTPGAPAPPVQGRVYTTSITMIDGTEQTLCELQYPSARGIGAMLVAPLAAQAPFIQTNKVILANAPSFATLHELWILGIAQIGTGGVVQNVGFDIPLDQMVQFDCIAQSLKISARLYRMQLSTDVGYSRATYSNPPIFNGSTLNMAGVVGGSGDPQQVMLQCTAGEGWKNGASNLTRRFRSIGVVAGGTDVAVPPTNADNFRVIAPTGTTADIRGVTFLTVGPGFGPIDYGSVGVDSATVRPIPEGCDSIVIKNNTAGAISFETLWGIPVSNPLGI